uniref:Uncharacterized protein n=1 Tax=Rousettus aegyptiacus TaxID=9407 RepID=A0A7J8E955_ROUAE|nr:hypothetical protein HJG63_008209 [Rousettus aegyptiacus]
MALVIQGLLCFHTNLIISCSIFLKNADGILMGIALNLYNTLGNKVILTMLILPIQEHRISFYFFVSSSVSFNRVLYFSLYRSFTCFVRFIPRYFIIFVVIAKEIIFSTFSDTLLLEYRNIIDF